eukprot:354065-Chlamydomonas_euryale.AAC.1
MPSLCRPSLHCSALYLPSQPSLQLLRRACAAASFSALLFISPGNPPCSFYAESVPPLPFLLCSLPPLATLPAATTPSLCRRFLFCSALYLPWQPPLQLLRRVCAAASFCSALYLTSQPSLQLLRRAQRAPLCAAQGARHSRLDGQLPRVACRVRKEARTRPGPITNGLEVRLAHTHTHTHTRLLWLPT